MTSYVYTIVVAPKARQMTIAVEIAAIRAGVSFEHCITWPRSQYVSNDSEHADLLRAKNRRDAYALAEDIRHRAARQIVAGNEIHLVIGPGVVLTTDPSTKTYATVVGADILRDIATVASCVFVAAGSDDPRDMGAEVPNPEPTEIPEIPTPTPAPRKRSPKAPSA